MLNTIPVQLRVIPSYPAYAAGDDGEIYRVTKPRFRRKDWQPRQLRRVKSGTSPYWAVTLSGGSREVRWHAVVHRLVAEAWLGPCPEGKEVNHKNLNKDDCSPGNLEYATPRRNQQHAIDNGAIELKLSDADVLSIQRSRHSLRCLAEEYGVHKTIIRRIKRGRRQLWGR